MPATMSSTPAPEMDYGVNSLGFPILNAPPPDQQAQLDAIADMLARDFPDPEVEQTMNAIHAGTAYVGTDANGEPAFYTPGTRGYNPGQASFSYVASTFIGGAVNTLSWGITDGAGLTHSNEVPADFAPVVSAGRNFVISTALGVATDGIAGVLDNSFAANAAASETLGTVTGGTSYYGENTLTLGSGPVEGLLEPYQSGPVVGPQLLDLGPVAENAGPIQAGARGGIGPVLQGQAGVDRAIAEIESQGGTILGREITVEAGGVRTRPDLLVQNAGGAIEFVEVKNGLSAGLTPNQTIGFPAIRTGGAIPRGANAAGAGLQPGVPLPPTPVRVIEYP